MIVEFLGESGCGKSTFADYLVSVDPSCRKKRQLSKLESMIQLLRLLANRKLRSLYLDTLSLSIEVNGADRLWKDAYYLLGIACELWKGQSDDEGIVLIDQGFLQYLCSIYFSKAIQGDKYKQTIRELFSWDIRVVYCYCPKEVLNKRIQERAGKVKETTRRIESASEKILEEHAKLFTLFLEEIPDERILYVDTSNDLQENALVFAKFVHSGR